MNFDKFNLPDSSPLSDPGVMKQFREMKFIKHAGSDIRNIQFDFEVERVLSDHDDDTIGKVVDYYVEIAEEFQQLVTLKLAELEKLETFDAPHCTGAGWKECVHLIIRRLLKGETPIVDKYRIRDNLVTDEKPLGDFTCSVSFKYSIRGWGIGSNKRSGYYSVLIAPGTIDHKAGIVRYDNKKIIIFFVDTDDAIDNIKDVTKILDSGHN